MDAVHTYEQSSKMLVRQMTDSRPGISSPQCLTKVGDVFFSRDLQNRCIQKRSEAHDVSVEEIKWLRVDYEIRCVQLVALCMLGARKSDANADNTPFLVRADLSWRSLLRARPTHLTHLTCVLHYVSLWCANAPTCSS